jgi:hypothetical protein
MARIENCLRYNNVGFEISKLLIELITMALVAKYNRLGGFNKKNLFSHNSRG